MRAATPVAENEAADDAQDGPPPPSRRRARALGAGLRIAALVGMLGALFWALDGRATLAALRGANPWIVLGAIGLTQTQFLLSAARWRFTAARLGLDLGFGRALAEYYVAGFLNQVLPGGVAGDAARAYRNRARREDGRLGWRASVRSVVMERAAGQIAFFAIAAGGLLAWPFVLPATAPDGVEALVAAPAVVVLCLAGVVAVAAARGPGAVKRALAELGPDLRRAFVERGAWWRQTLASLAIVSSYIAVFVLCGAAMGVDIPPIGWFTVAPLVLLAMVVPISVGGWGLREGAAVALFPLVGVDASKALAIAILYGLVNLAGAAPGLALALRRRAPE